MNQGPEESLGSIEARLSTQFEEYLGTASRVDARLVASLRATAISLLEEERKRVKSGQDEAIATLTTALLSRVMKPRHEGELTVYQRYHLARQRRETVRLQQIEQEKEAIRSATPQELAWNLEAYQKAKRERQGFLDPAHFEFKRIIKGKLTVWNSASTLSPVSSEKKI